MKKGFFDETSSGDVFNVITTTAATRHFQLVFYRFATTWKWPGVDARWRVTRLDWSIRIMYTDSRCPPHALSNFSSPTWRSAQPPRANLNIPRLFKLNKLYPCHLYTWIFIISKLCLKCRTDVRLFILKNKVLKPIHHTETQRGISTSHQYKLS